ncbi:hypothetical protein TNCV_2385231 [Trichonephila clavipes]|nr:hypothetical protein TNCV_2385231 [Trichonephila clavipes]
MNMNRYTNAELVDIHFIYRLAYGNRRAAVRLPPVSLLLFPQANMALPFKASDRLATNRWPLHISLEKMVRYGEEEMCVGVTCGDKTEPSLRWWRANPRSFQSRMEGA